MNISRSVFLRNGYEVLSLSPDGIYHVRHRNPENGDVAFDGLAILLFPAHVYEDGFPHQTFNYGENGEEIWGEDPGVEEPWRLASEVIAVMGNCLVDGVFSYERAEALRNRYSATTASWLSENEIDGCYRSAYPFVGDISSDGLGVVVRDKQVVSRDEARVRCFAEFESGDIVFYH